MSQCPCGTESSYESCCEIYHKGAKSPETAEKLMRARYSAFAKSQIDFIASTHLPGTEDFDPKEAKVWADGSEWLGLEIVKTEKGNESDNKGVVEFKARYKDKASDKTLVHHEIATFEKQNSTWYYKDGQIYGLAPIKRTEPKIGRNDPCLCGSGKKYKKCCAA